MLKSFTKNEPVLVSHAVAWFLANLGAVIIGHTALITSSDWSSLTTTLTPIITAAVIAGIAWATRKFTTPVAKTSKTDA